MPKLREPAALTTTSYAILGLLAVKPWTTYELAKQMRRALGQFWPRAESKLYEEPKKLVEHGLARAAKETTGKRPRTVYSITPRGRRAMGAWVRLPGAAPVLEFEGLVKLFYAEHGSKQDVLATLERVRERRAEQSRASEGISEAYLRGEGQFPERLPWLVLCGQFLEELDIAIERWLEWAGATVAGWPDDITEAEPDLKTLEAQARRAAASRPGAIDWDEWARRAERALAFEQEGSWRDLFAPDATFGDPATPATTDLRAVQRGTAAIFPDWTQEITTIRGDDTSAVFEWIGRATYAGRSPDDPAAGTRVEMHGATIVEVDADGLVVSWRDYLDRKEPEDQLRAAAKRQAGVTQ